MVPVRRPGIVRTALPVAAGIAGTVVVVAIVGWIVLHVLVQLILVALLPLVLTIFFDRAFNLAGGLSRLYLRFIIGSMGILVVVAISLGRLLAPIAAARLRGRRP